MKFIKNLVLKAWKNKGSIGKVLLWLWLLGRIEMLHFKMDYAVGGLEAIWEVLNYVAAMAGRMI